MGQILGISRTCSLAAEWETDLAGLQQEQILVLTCGLSIEQPLQTLVWGSNLINDFLLCGA